MTLEPRISNYNKNKIPLISYTVLLLIDLLISRSKSVFSLEDKDNNFGENIKTLS